MDASRACALSQASLRFPDAIYIAAAECFETTLLTADARMARSVAPVRYAIRTVEP